MKRIVFLSMIALLFASFNLQAQKEVKPKNQTQEEAKPNKKNKNKVPEITFESLEHDYGNIYKGDNGVCEFKFKNTGKAPLLITNARSSCGCTVPEWPKEEIAPGKTAVIKVKYDTKRIGTISKSITIESNAINNNVVLHIKGYISETPTQGTPENSQSPMMKAQ